MAARNLGGFVPNKIFVGGVPITCTEDQFKSYFEPFGPISKVELHALRGFGYITYESVEAVDACLEKYEDHYLSKKWVEVKRSIPRELIDSYEREQKRLLAEYMASGEETEPAAIVPEGRSPKVEPAPVPSVAPAWGASSAPRKTHEEPPNTVMLSRIKQLKEMGFSEEVARRVLSDCVWDVNEAIDRLLATMTSEAGDSSGPSGESAEVQPRPALEVSVDELPAPTVPSGANAAESESQGGGSSSSSQCPAGSAAQRAVSPPASASPSGVTNGEVNLGLGASSSPEGAVVGVGEVGDSPAQAYTAASESTVPPRKRIERAARAWTAEDPSQLNVAEGDFVNVWVDTSTVHGWIHAEKHGANQSVGWLPVCHLHTLPETQRWMNTRQRWQALDEHQCSVTEGRMAVVWVNSRTAEGWTYVEVQEDGATRPGWLPVFCLDWNED